MARLQDFNTVTPTANDKFLIVQSQGQGLASHTIKLDSANPTGTGSLSLNRKSGTTVGTNSVAEGHNGTASGDYSHAEGEITTASGKSSHAEGTATIANHRSQHVFGFYNIADPSTAAATSRGTYAEIVGNGTSDSARSNARTLDWSGNEVLAGGLKVNGSDDVRGVTRFTLPKDSSKTVTVSKDGTMVGFLVSVVGNIETLNSFLLYVAGYATASRCNVVNLSNISGATAFSITATNTSNTIFTFTNSSTTNDAEVALLPLFDNKFTIT